MMQPSWLVRRAFFGEPMLFLDGLCKKPADSVFHSTHWREILGNLEGDRLIQLFSLLMSCSVYY